MLHWCAAAVWWCDRMILSIRYDALQYEVISWPEYVYPSGNSDLQPLTLWCKFNQYKAAFIYIKKHVILCVFGTIVL